MYRVILLILVFVLSSCGDKSTDDKQTKSNLDDINKNKVTKNQSDLPPKPNVEYLAELAEKKIRADNPKYNPDAIFSAEIVDVPDLWEKLNIVVFNTKTSVTDSVCYMIFFNGKVQNFVNTFGGSLDSILVLHDKLYYSYSFGSGMHYVSIGKLWIDKGKVMQSEYTSFLDNGHGVDADLMLGVKDGKVIVYTSKYPVDNNPVADKLIGWLKTKDNGEMVIVTNDGTEIRSKEYNENQQTQPKGD